MSRSGIAFALVFAVGCAPASTGLPVPPPVTRPTAPPEPTICYAQEAGRFEVSGLPPAAATDPGRTLRVSVSADADLLGTTGVSDGVVWFRPRFPVAPGVPHTVTFDPPGGPRLTATITLPEPETEPTTVTAVYPTADTVPENVLRFYVQFSAPVRRGEAYRRVKLTDAAGTVADLPFLELDEELWDPTGTRLTLLIDPGRIKRGVKPLADLGPVFAAGTRYTLTVDAGWTDAHGKPLAAGVVKRFTAGPAVRERIDPRSWDVLAPSDPTAELVVRFPRPLDRGLLERSLTVVEAKGRRIDGAVTVAPGEAGWRFAPAGPWAVGGYELRIDPDLEDVAGNRPDRVFDAAGPDPGGPPVLRRTFQVSGRPE